jgi:ribosome-associated heat shock protein Hsp15
LWSVRLTKTRSDAAEACRGGHVKINDKTAKPSSPVKIGDRIEARLGRRQRIADVQRLVHKRVGAELAVDCFDDLSPPPPPQQELTEAVVGRRDPGTGRPTKRDRRKIDELRGRDRSLDRNR